MSDPGGIFGAAGSAAEGGDDGDPNPPSRRTRGLDMTDMATPAGTADQSPLRVAIVGQVGGTNVGDSLRHAATASGHKVSFFDAEGAAVGPRLLRALAWRVNRRPISLDRFSERIAGACERHPPDLLITTGVGFLSAEALQSIGRLGVTTANYSTDDPWNPTSKAAWHLEALPYYSFVFTPRRANIEDLRRLGCASPIYLPFGYDERHAFPPARPIRPDETNDVLFVGGADRDRVSFVTAFVDHGAPVSLVGRYWGHFSDTKPWTLGYKNPEELRALTIGAKVNLCLVRRANRDGHVMRSLEIGAIGGCMLAEDTQEHRELFGPEGETVLYFDSPQQAAEKARSLIADEPERRRLAAALHSRITGGHHTYGDRVEAMLSVLRPSPRANGGDHA
jgi:hypothetical protein